MFCPKCGAQIPNGAKFCGGCGTKIEQQQAPQPQKPQPEKPPKPTVPKKKTGLIIGIVTGAVALVAIVIILIITLTGSGSNPDVASITFNGITVSQGDTFGKMEEIGFEFEDNNDEEVVNGYLEEYDVEQGMYANTFTNGEGCYTALVTYSPSTDIPLSDLLIDDFEVAYDDSVDGVDTDIKLAGIRTHFNVGCTADDVISALYSNGFDQYDIEFITDAINSDDIMYYFNELEDRTFYITNNDDIIIKINDNVYYEITTANEGIYSFSMLHPQYFLYYNL